MDKLISALVEAQKKISNANRTAMNDFSKVKRTGLEVLMQLLKMLFKQ